MTWHHDKWYIEDSNLGKSCIMIEHDDVQWWCSMMLFNDDVQWWCSMMMFNNTDTSNTSWDSIILNKSYSTWLFSTIHLWSTLRLPNPHRSTPPTPKSFVPPVRPATAAGDARAPRSLVVALRMQNVCLMWPVPVSCFLKTTECITMHPISCQNCENVWDWEVNQCSQQACGGSCSSCGNGLH